MRRYVIPLVLLLVLVMPSTASANGSNKGKIVRDCNHPDVAVALPLPPDQWTKPGVPESIYVSPAGGVQVYAGQLRSRNHRVMCAFLVQREADEEPTGVFWADAKLNRRGNGEI